MGAALLCHFELYIITNTYQICPFTAGRDRLLKEKHGGTEVQCATFQLLPEVQGPYLVSCNVE